MKSTFDWLTDGPYLRALCAWPGTRHETANDLVTAGQYDAGQMIKDGYSAVAVHDRPLRELLLDAGNRALTSAKLEGEDLALIIHTSIHEHGYEGLWQPAAALQHALGASNTLAWSLNHGCNGQMLAMMQAGLLLSKLQGAALVTGGDLFSGTTFNRWQSDRGLVYGDAVTAAILDASQGFAQIIYCDAEFAPELETLHGGITPLKKSGADAWDVTRTKQAFFTEHGSTYFFNAIDQTITRLRTRLDEVLSRLDRGIDAVVTPFVGQSITRTIYEAAFNHYAPGINAVDYGLSVGHTGTSDQLLGLAYHLKKGQLEQGSRILLIGAGAGFGITAMILRLNRTPVILNEGVFS